MDRGKFDQSVALGDYLTMGTSRSLAKLHQKYTETAPDSAPSLGCLKRWSRTHGWTETAREHDAKVAAAVREKLEGDAIEETYSTIQALRDIERRAYERLMATLAALETKNTVAEVQALLSIMIEASKHAMVCEGGVSDRTERRTAAPADEEALRELAAVFRSAAAEDGGKGKGGGRIH